MLRKIKRNVSHNVKANKVCTAENKKITIARVVDVLEVVLNTVPLPEYVVLNVVINVVNVVRVVEVVLNTVPVA